jgi:hypothetical protein
VKLGEIASNWPGETAYPLRNSSRYPCYYYICITAVLNVDKGVGTSKTKFHFQKLAFEHLIFAKELLGCNKSTYRTK